MADVGPSCSSSSHGFGILGQAPSSEDRLKALYPAVNEAETPLPRFWNTKDKFNSIGLSQNNLRVHYKGIGKNQKDAAAVRGNNPIPAACGLYYFEVKIISKGRNGHMGIGLSGQVVPLSRLPGWDKHSYGYHGDDGHAFCSSPTGQPYGPTFTTGDVIGCGVNFIDNTCFYTKNGHNLGIAFTDLPPNLYPMVGLQTQGEIVDANFGQCPFMFDIEDMMKEIRARTRLTIENLPTDCLKDDWQTLLQRIVQSYLVHHGYCLTAEAFAKTSGQPFTEEHQSMRNRQKIQTLVLAGRIGEAVDLTQTLYPGLLDENGTLLFQLKCRQFIEIINGTDSEVRCLRPTTMTHKSRHASGDCSPSSCKSCSPSMSPKHNSPSPSPVSHRPSRTGRKHNPKTAKSRNNMNIISNSKQPSAASPLPVYSDSYHTTDEMNGTSTVILSKSGLTSRGSADVDMIDSRDAVDGICFSNGVTTNGTSMDVNLMNGGCCHDTVNGVSTVVDDSEYHVVDGDINVNTGLNDVEQGAELEQTDDENEMDVDVSSATDSRKELCGGSEAAIQKMLSFGRELHQMSQQLEQTSSFTSSLKKILQDAFSLLAYSDAWNSPIGHQLDPTQREPICAALNSAILESVNLPSKPPLEVAIGQSFECMKLMSKSGIGSCAFVNIKNYLQ